MRRPAQRRPDRLSPARGSQTPASRPVTGTAVVGTAAQAVDAGALLQAAVGHHQAGRLNEAEQLYRQVLAVHAEQPDALHLLGVLAYQVGRADVAVSLIEQAIAQRPNAPAFPFNLGNALLALGRQQDAVTAYRRAIELAPADPEAHYNLGNSLVQLDDLAAGIAELRRTIQLRPEHADAQYNLGNALRIAGQPAEAIAAYRAAVGLRPQFADAHANLGMVWHETGRHEEAQRCFDQALTLRPDDPTALRGLAGIAQTGGNHAEAAALLAQLVQAAPNDPFAHDHLARELLATGQPAAALAAVTAGLEQHPQDRPLLQTLVSLLQTAAVPNIGPAAVTIRAALLAVVTDDTFNIQQLATPIARLIMAAPEYPQLLAAVDADVDLLVAATPLPAALIAEPAVLAALPRVIICTPEIERILTGIRRAVLFQMADQIAQPPQLALPTAGEEEEEESSTGRSIAGLPYPFLCALAGAAFLSEYAWLIPPDEAACLESVQAEVAALLADPAGDLPAAEARLLLAALYGRLGLAPGAARLAAVPEAAWSASFAAIIREQVQEPISEHKLAAAMPSITPIADATSRAVQTMYEENPYPRWRAARFHAAEPLTERFRTLCPGEPVPNWPAPLPVLVAGAGTGQHPIQTALRLPEADVLAVDLSRASLGYGARMAGRLGVENLRFGQADILALDVLEQRFALIECGGVLHHLADPMAGWAVLRRLLRPDGLMLIALYSERARASIVAAREFIRGLMIPATADGIRGARQQIMELPPTHPAAGLSRFWDFYSQSGFRDLAMHVQEHRFTIPQLAASLDALDLRFLGFEVPPSVQQRFRARFPMPGSTLDLNCWDAFEADYPDTFASMYQLWCRPR